MRSTVIPALLLALCAAACEGGTPDQDQAPSPRGRARVIHDIPVRPGAIIVDTTGTVEAERATYRTPEAFDTVTNYYKQLLPRLGYQILNQRGDSAILDLYSRKERRDLWMHFERRPIGTEWTVLGSAAPVPDSSRLKRMIP